MISQNDHAQDRAPTEIGPPKRLLKDLHSKWGRFRVSAASTMERTDSRIGELKRMGPTWDIQGTPRNLAGDDHSEISPESFTREGKPKRIMSLTEIRSEPTQGVTSYYPHPVGADTPSHPISILKPRSLSESPSNSGNRVRFSKQKTVIRFVPYSLGSTKLFKM